MKVVVVVSLAGIAHNVDAVLKHLNCASFRAIPFDGGSLSVLANNYTSEEHQRVCINAYYLVVRKLLV